MNKLLKNWDIGAIRAIEPIPSFWGRTSLIRTVEGCCFILKEKSDLSRTKQEFDLLSSLSKVGAPVAVQILTTKGEWVASDQGRHFCLYPSLPGKVIAEHYAGDAKERAGTFGQSIGLLHISLLKCNCRNDFQDLDLLRQIQVWAIPSIRKYGGNLDLRTIEKIWGEVEQEMMSIDRELPKQLIHRDLNPANMLFDRGKLTGFVDFEMVVRGSRIFDVCYCGTSILVGGFQDSAKVAQWPGIFQALLQGYQESCPLSLLELRALFGTLEAIELLFLAFSLETHAEGAARCNANVLNWLSKNKDQFSV
jgi:Ser/Thr protein kinase RdoA (MazF antagonist)